MSSIRQTYMILCVGGNRIVTRVRNLTMYQYGSTIGPSRFPKFVNPLTHGQSMLPRPVVKSRPINLGHTIMKNCQWLRFISKCVEMLTIKHLFLDKSEKSLFVRNKVRAAKKLIPPCLRICNTFFTQMIMVGSPNENSGQIPAHLDNDDHITALVSIGDNEMYGGSTCYYEGQSLKECKKRHEIKFRNLNVQIGYFDSVIHGSLSWNNNLRGVISFSLQKKVLHHFEQFGNHFYQQYINDLYPSGEFLAT